MPKVDKITLKIKGESKTFDIYFNVKEGFYIKNFPNEIQTITDINVQNQSSLHALKGEASRALWKYHELIKEEKKVIAYRLVLSSAMYMNPQNGGYMGYQPWAEGFGRTMADTPFGTPQYAIGLEYKIYIESQMGSKSYFPIDKNGVKGNEASELAMRKWVIIDWTEERENAFKSITDSMQKLARKMGEILLDKDKAIQLLESGIKMIE